MTGVISFIFSAVIGGVIGTVIMAFMAGAHQGDDDGFSCWGCKHTEGEVNFEDPDAPCNHCRRCFGDQWEARGQKQ